MQRLVIMGASALLALTAVACSGASADDTARPTATPPGVAVGEPTPGTGGGAPPPGSRDQLETKIVPAPILEAELEVRESWPPQYAVRLLAEIGDGCHAFERVDVERDGDAIAITVLRRAPAHPELVLCTMQYQTHEETVNLGSDFESGREYSVVLNDGERTLSFTAQ